ncbi:MAG TPA: ABC transporter ATP-binding protein, partial [Dehalococcoidia bacterium]|nr:ABC transporter ATP-binding protein [Dehalococcoidia bacterium]
IAFGVLLMLFMLAAPMGIAGTIKMWYFRIRNIILERQGRAAPAVPPEAVGVPTFGAAEIEGGDIAGGNPAPANPVSRKYSTARPSSFGDTILEVRGVSKSFAAVQALRGIDVSVRQGEILGVIGPNGSGKTTLFNCISGFLPVTEGDIRWRGRDITKWTPDRVARHGLVRTFQQAMLFRSTTVYSSLRVARESLNAFGYRETATLDLPGDVDGLLEFCDLSHVADQPAAMLPYGLVRKLGVALALATFPYLLMLDEPAAGLNDIESQELGELLLRARAAGVTLIVVDHDMPFIMPISDRMVVLDAGQKILEGTPQEVQADQRVIAAYLGERFAKMAADMQEAGDK